MSGTITVNGGASFLFGSDGKCSHLVVAPGDINFEGSSCTEAAYGTVCPFFGKGGKKVDIARGGL